MLWSTSCSFDFIYYNQSVSQSIGLSVGQSLSLFEDLQISLGPRFVESGLDASQLVLHSFKVQIRSAFVFQHLSQSLVVLVHHLLQLLRVSLYLLESRSQFFDLVSELTDLSFPDLLQLLVTKSHFSLTSLWPALLSAPALSSLGCTPPEPSRTGVWLSSPSLPSPEPGVWIATRTFGSSSLFVPSPLPNQIQSSSPRSLSWCGGSRSSPWVHSARPWVCLLLSSMSSVCWSSPRWRRVLSSQPAPFSPSVLWSSLWLTLTHSLTVSLLQLHLFFSDHHILLQSLNMFLVHSLLHLFQHSQLLQLHFVSVHVLVRQEDCFQRLGSSLVRSCSYLRLHTRIRGRRVS